MSQDDPRLDVRVLEFHLRRGTLTREEYDKVLSGLPDEADEAVETQVRFAANFEARAYGEGADGSEDQAAE